MKIAPTFLRPLPLRPGLIFRMHKIFLELGRGRDKEKTIYLTKGSGKNIRKVWVRMNKKRKDTLDE